MKKILFSLFIILAMNVNAQTFDETLLVGTWKPTNITGTLPYRIQSFSSIILGDCVDDEDEGGWSGYITDLWYVDEYRKDEDDYDEYILDFFISNNNKLHILVGDDYALRFIIEELTETSLKVKTYDGICSITFAKDGSTKVAPVSKTSAQETDTYSLSGQKVANPLPNTIYIKDGQKKLATK